MLARLAFPWILLPTLSSGAVVGTGFSNIHCSDDAGDDDRTSGSNMAMFDCEQKSSLNLVQTHMKRIVKKDKVTAGGSSSTELQGVSSRNPVSPTFETGPLIQSTGEMKTGAKQPASGYTMHNHISSTVFAVIYVVIVASIPLLPFYWERRTKPLTMSQQVQIGTFLFWLFGGIYMITQHVMFTSSKFTEPRSLTLVESVYVMSQIITTVGYGDITPAYPKGMLVIGVYVVLSVFMVAGMVGEVVAIFVDHMERVTAQKIEDLEESLEQSMDGPQSTQSAGTRSQDSGPIKLKDWAQGFKIPWMHGLVSLTLLLVFLFLGVMFFEFYADESKTLGEAIYMGLITLSTVGFGANVPQTDDGEVFCAFWMILGAAVLANSVAMMGRIFYMVRSWERHSPQQEASDFYKIVDETPKDEDGLIDEAAFLQFYLRHLDLVPEETMNLLKRQYQAFGPDAKGKVKMASVANVEAPPQKSLDAKSSQSTTI
eukprot:gnl/TRDRNA2_/TRDRNA2_85861_c0_seq1.p1 gnl/TRDRNA2_/TRDRNA2_85861_c0~~gnl/TRDRNA2_/TRDRNA2_85861_c0_seq1.p1  ORF type:complete len:484 (+),score=56.01 gnl/TRDRNA2_/TRDRNA2_85861_c0_seq1:42-1493(+)